MISVQDFVRSLPKAELHVHLEGCITPEQMIAIGHRNSVDTFCSVDAARKAYAVSDLESFLSIYAKALGVLRTPADFTEVAKAYFVQAAGEGVRHVELMFDPQAHMVRGVALADVLTGLIVAKRHATTLGISSALVANFMREREEKEAMDVLEALQPWREHVIAVGLDSAEIGYPPARFSRLFNRARSMGLGLVAHAGFEGPVADIQEAVDLLGVDRVDHGNRVYECSPLAMRLGEAGTAITVCPCSEVQLRVVSSLAEHPVRSMLHDGMRPSIHSDDPAWFGSITDNYLSLAKEGGLSHHEAAQLARNSFSSSFLDEGMVSRYVAEIDAKLRAAMP